MRKETARDFWRRYLRLACNGFASTSVRNPLLGLCVKAKAGEYDDLSDKEYNELVKDYEQLSAIWQKKPERAAGDILFEALRMTEISKGQCEKIVELLAECSSYCDYLADSKTPDAGPSPRSAGMCDMDAVDDKADMYDWSPRSIYDHLCQRVHGQEEAKKAAAMVVYNHVAGRRTNAVFCGPSGCGKSEIWRYLAKDFPRIIRIVDASRLCAEGWKGSLHLRDIFEGIPEEDLKHRGLIVVLDEADKVCCEKAVGSGGTDYNSMVQNSLLKMLDGDVIEFGEENNKKAFMVDCSRVSVVFLGAFEQLLKGKSSDSGSIGFGADMRTECDYSNTDISYADLISAGMRREIAGRINRIVSLRPLSVSDYKTILTGPVLGDIQNAGKYRVEIDSSSADFLAEQAAATGLGVRWMKSQIMNELDNLMFDDPAADVYAIKIGPCYAPSCM